MATTKIWAIKGSVSSLVNYIENPEKTTGESDIDAKALLHVLNYTTNSNKTEQKLFVSGVNCLPEIAIKQMVLTKKQFDKTDKILAHHAIQSFEPGEVTPEQCYEIGVKLAQKMWGDRFQVVVATHLDKSHLHNHFALNSVSYKDGGKYDSCNAATQHLRDVSDSLCREYSLSVIENPGKSPPRMIYLAEKNGEPTKYNVFRQAIDRAIDGALTQRQYENILRLQGFEMKLTGKHWTIKIIGDKRATRLYRLGEQYTGQAIIDRIYGGVLLKRVVPYIKPQSIVKTYKFIGNLKQVKGITGFRALYYYYLYRMGVLPKNNPRPPRHPLLWEDVRQLRKYTAQIRLLGNNKIDTSEQLQAYVDTTKGRMEELILQRTHIQNKLRRAKEPEVIEELKTEKTALTEQITPLRRDLSIAAEIEERAKKMREKLSIIREVESQERLKLLQSKQRGAQHYAR